MSTPHQLKGARRKSGIRITPNTTPVANPRLSRSRVTMSSSDRPLSQYIDQHGTLRQASTLEGRTRLICVTPSRTRESWLSRGRSPSAHSSSSTRAIHGVRQSKFPNSFSDGALMNRLADGSNSSINEPCPIKAPPPVILAPVDTSHSKTKTQKPNVRPNTSDRIMPKSSSYTVPSPTDGNHTERLLDVEKDHISIPRQQPARSNLLGSKEEVKPVSNVKRIPSFTQHLLLNTCGEPRTKADGRTCDYPLETWFATSEPEQKVSVVTTHGILRSKFTG